MPISFSLIGFSSLSFTEGLSSILHAARQANLLKGIRMTRQCPPTSYRFFVDDSFMFGQGNLDEAAMYDTLTKKKNTMWHQDKKGTKGGLLYTVVLILIPGQRPKSQHYRGFTNFPNKINIWVLIFFSSAFAAKILLASQEKFLLQPKLDR